jgi:hypothetical protein
MRSLRRFGALPTSILIAASRREEERGHSLGSACIRETEYCSGSLRVPG